MGKREIGKCLDRRQKRTVMKCMASLNLSPTTHKALGLESIVSSVKGDDNSIHLS